MRESVEAWETVGGDEGVLIGACVAESAPEGRPRVGDEGGSSDAREEGAPPPGQGEDPHCEDPLDEEDGAQRKEGACRNNGKHRKKRGEANAELGKRGEDAAARFLYRRGYDIVERNWKCKAGEADIIARDGNAVVFVEVKTRTGVEKGLPSEAVNAKKREKYEKIAALFLAGYDVVDVPVRFDVVSLLVIAPDRALIRHHINAFAAG